MDRVIIYHLYKFPEAKTKSDQELELYIQRIVRAIDAVQIYILTTFFKKTTIRIFPIALPSKVDNVELVFNGYKKKYIDKVLREFICCQNILILN